MRSREKELSCLLHSTFNVFTKNERLIATNNIPVCLINRVLINADKFNHLIFLSELCVYLASITERKSSVFCFKVLLHYVHAACVILPEA